MILIVRREAGQLRRYIHLGTGNYHARNAKLYTDFSLFTCHEGLCEDAHKVFQQLTGMGRTAKYKQLICSPFTLHNRMLQLIEKERQQALAGKEAKVIIKVNGLTEPQIIQALYRCSQAGAQIILLIRGICCLRPGIPGVSENIIVRSIVGRFLEHTRVFYFHNTGDPIVYLSSADWMERNFFNRIETCFPILSPHLKERVITEALDTYCHDNIDAWSLEASGEYTLASDHPLGTEIHCAQDTLRNNLSEK